MTNYTIPNLHSIFILTLYIFLASYDNKLQLINAEITENRDYTINELMNDPDNQYLGVAKESTISVQVPIPEPQLTELNAVNNQVYIPTSPYIGYNKVTVAVPQIQNELLQNKRIQSSGNYTVQSLMNNPVDYAGISKTSNIIVDIPELDITQISNYPISQNGTQTIPIPTGYDAVDSISVNVNVQGQYPIIINKCAVFSTTDNPTPLSDFTLVTQNVTINIYRKVLIEAREATNTTTLYLYNGYETQSSITLTTSASLTKRYYIFNMYNNLDNRVLFYNNSISLFTILDLNVADQAPSVMAFNKTVVSFDWS